MSLPLTVEADREPQLGTELPNASQKCGQGHAGTLGTSHPAQKGRLMATETSACWSYCHRHQAVVGVEVDYRQGLQVLDLPHATSTSPGLASATGTAQMCSCKQRFAATAHNTALSSTGNVGGDQGLVLTWQFPRLSVLHLAHWQ